MSSSDAQESSGGRYGAAAIVLHWASAVLLAGLFVLAWQLEDAGEAAHAALLGWHRTLGLTLLAVTAARLAHRVASPPGASSGGPWARRAAAAVHAALYGLLLAQPVLGWALSSARGQAVMLAGIVLPALTEADRPLARALFAWHGRAATGLLLLVTLHTLAALAHAMRPGDRVLAGMLPFRRARSIRSCSRRDPRRRR